MRRAVGLTIVGLATLLVGDSPAGAGCPGADGTLPGSQATVHTIATPAATLYVDDRDYLDLDDDGDADGLWLYRETNGAAGLQRGGDWVGQPALDVLDRPLPPLYPIPVDADGDGEPDAVLFPNGFGGGCTCEGIRARDECRDGPEPGDQLLF